MANIKSFPNNQDVYIGAEDVMKWLHGRTSGVFAANGNAAVSALVDSSMAVTVSDGLGWMANAGKDGVVWWIDHEAPNGAKLQLDIDPADGVLNRIDRIIVEWKTTNYVDYPEVKVLKGRFSSKATAPALTNNSTVRQISLAKISIAAGTTAITPRMITDERLDDAVCGIVAEGVSIDTSVMQEQFEELLTVIQKELDDLNNSTAALLKAGGTMYGVLDMGGNNIKNVAIPTTNTDAVNKEYADRKLSMELLWQNGETGSNFLDQTIKLDLIDYKAFLVKFKFSRSSTVVFSTICWKGTNQITFSQYRNTYRNMFIRDTNVEFSVARYYKTYGSTATTIDNSTLIPIEIYGIKGVPA